MTLPSTTDRSLGGPDSLNPLLRADGSCAINPDWPERRGLGVNGSPAVIAGGSSDRGGRSTASQHDRGSVRRVVLTWSLASAADVGLIQRMLTVTGWGASATGFRHPMLDPPGSVASAPLVRPVPGTFSLERSAGGVTASMRITLEYV